MANEAGNTYIGCRISLISKADIRYEGILHSIDTENSTVALSCVKSFGTEDRQTERIVAPRTDIYEYIIFRGKDIKDLTVCEAPPPPQFLDPAILASSNQNALGSPVPNFPTSLSNFEPNLNSADSQHPIISTQQASSVASISISEKPTNTNTTSSKPQPGSYNRNARSNQMEYPSHGSQNDYRRPNNYEFRGQGRRLTSNQMHDREMFNGWRGHGGRGGRGFRGGYGGYQGGWMPENYRMHHHPHPPSLMRGFGRGNRGNNRGSRSDGMKDFDFEAANKEFEKLELGGKEVSGDEEAEEEAHEVEEKEEEEKEVEEVCLFYNPKTSFFDKISCDANVEKVSGKPDWHKEKQLNKETFGVANVSGPRSFYRRDGGVRGGGTRGYRGRSRGYHRGGGSEFRNYHQSAQVRPVAS